MSYSQRCTVVNIVPVFLYLFYIYPKVKTLKNIANCSFWDCDLQKDL